MNGLRWVAWAVVAAGVLHGSAAAQARPLTDAEEIYAQLAKLPPQERAKKIEDGARAEGTFVIVSGFSGPPGRNHIALFEKRYPFLKVERTERGAEDSIELFMIESTAGRHLTDVFTASVASAGPALRADLSAHYPTPATDKVLPELREFLDPQHRWVPYIWSEHGISYNTNMLTPAEAPKSWGDLCDPRFKGTVSFDPLEIRFLAGLKVMMGEEKLKSWLECMGKNKPIIQRGHTTRLNLMIAGDHAVQGDNYLYDCIEQHRRNNAPCAAVFSTPIIGYGNGMYINKDAPHPYAAALYLDWALSDESQKYVRGVGRNPMTMTSASLPEKLNIVTYTYPEDDEKDRLESYWRKYMEGR
jgi:iron(III) transport system substrate-binding protein